MVGSVLTKVVNGVETTIYPYTAAEFVQYQSTSIKEYLDRNLMSMSAGTRDHWNKEENAAYIPKIGELVMYYDGEIIEEDGVQVKIPYLKIGDGVTAVNALPFVGTEALTQHINNSEIHVSPDDREGWNSKASVSFDGSTETLIIS